MKGVGIPEIVIVLGLLIVLIAGFLPSGAPSQSKEYLLLSKQAGPIGASGFNYDHIPLSSNLILSKGVDGSPLFIKNNQVEVAKGIITTQEQEIEFSIPSNTINELSSATFSLTITETNGYGPLKIFLNGKEIWSDLVKVSESLSIPLPLDDLFESNIIKITAGSSGWKIWSPTYYILEKIQIKEKLTSGEEVSFDFELTEEQLEKFDRGRIYIGNVNPIIQGELAIILNDERIIFRGIPGEASFITSFSSGAQKENTITFKLLEDGHYELRNLEVIIFTATNSTGGFSTEFTIPVEELSKMRAGTKEGLVEIEILETSENLLQIILSGEEDVELYNNIPDEGKISLKFTGFEATKNNVLTIRSGGEYNLGTINIKLVEK